MKKVVDKASNSLVHDDKMCMGITEHKSEVERLYGEVDRVRRKLGLSVPKFRHIFEYTTAKRKYRIHLGLGGMLVVSDKMPINCMGYDTLYQHIKDCDYMRIAKSIGIGNKAVALYYKRDKVYHIADAGKIDLRYKCVVREVFGDEV